MSTTVTAPPRPTPMPTPAPDYPVHVWADAQPDASRWLWLVKWLLLIPHLVVLALLWVAFVVMSVAAFVAILVTGRYPRSVFEFTVGVMRWSWRVSYYGYSALATDRYPPFSLADVPDYPAHLEVDYPERLSRGHVLVKWWLLALPHYVVVGILVGGGGSWWVANDDSAARFAWGGGLIGLLVLVGAVVLGVTGRYPRSLYDLVLGLNRWVLRVTGYAALMTDAYPPFRLDLGPGEPGDADAPRRPIDPASPVATPVATPSAAHAGGGWTTGRVVSVVVGSVLGLTALGMVTGGVALLVADNAMRDGSGYLSSAERQVSSSGYAVVAPSMRIHTSRGAGMVPQRMMGDVRLRVTASGGHPVFVGIASSSDVDRYLGDVARTVPDSDWADGREVTGTPPAGPPTDQPIWDASVMGTGTQELIWAPRSGDWAVVLMNADGSADVSAQVSVGAELPWMSTLGGGLLFVGVIVLAGSVLLVAAAARRASRLASPPHPVGA